MAKIFMYNILLYSFVIIFLYGTTSVKSEDVITTPKINKFTEPHPARDFSRHTIIKPKIYHGSEKEQVSTTKKENQNDHHDHISIALSVNNENIILDLTLNKQLLSDQFFRKTQENGTYKIHKAQKENTELCHYNGKVRGKANSWVGISTCEGLSGVFFDGKELHYIEKLNLTDDHHILYKHSDLNEHNKTCGYEGNAYADHIFTRSNNNTNRMHRYKRSTSQNNEVVRGPYNANKESKYVELVLVIDNREYKELGESTTKVERHAKTIANIINGLYAPLNIFIALVGVVIWTEHDEISFSPNGDTTLTNFLHYRREKLVKEHPNDNAQLLTKFTFENGVVGKALKGPICTYEYSGGVNTDHSPVVGLVATTVAHEMGHNFGMEHDTNECKCPEDRCIMAPSSSTIAPTHWSSCSLNYLLLAFTHGMDYCLKNKPSFLFDSPICGNGFVEPGEQCDCGLPEHCDNYCCNAVTCMLHSNASCATGECCDLNTCKPKNVGTLCRSADYECDLPEYCTGQSEYCPKNIYKMDTEICDNGKSYCYHGFCRTRTDQCKLLWGVTGTSSDDQCYKMNVKGTRHGNCGYNKFNQSFFKCNDENVLCGMLHCKHLNERLEFGMESVSILSHTFINFNDAIVPCRTAIVDLGINEIDPGLTPDGARCGDKKMCVNQRCLSVDNLKIANNCENNCNGNGWCNSLGHCHCKDGYAPPFCENPGPGGSEDSGPASDPNAHKDFVYALFIIFLGIIPGIALCSLLIYYMKHNVIRFGGPKTSTQSTFKSPTKPRNSTFSSSEVTKRNEDNHSLLQDDNNTATISIQNEFFGHFKGFTLIPIKNNNKNESIGSNTLPPPSSTVIIKSPLINKSTTNNSKGNFLNKSAIKANSFKQNLTEAFAGINNSSTAPDLPPPNNSNSNSNNNNAGGSSIKPVISSPILENSTCTAKELLSPLKNAPKIPIRPAPEAPTSTSSSINNDYKRPLSITNTTITTTITTTTTTNSETLANDDIKKSSSNKINRIASFLKDKKPNTTNSLPRTNQQVKANKILDKNILRNIEISNPIPQNNIELGMKTLPITSTTNNNDNEQQNKAVILRAQSMRGNNVTPRPNIHTFGSMRQSNCNKRPVSIPSANRPKSPPPPRPNPLIQQQQQNDKNKIEGLPGYQKPVIKSSHYNNEYDDCLNKNAPLANLSEISPTSSDNIYAVIEESPVISPDSINTIKSNSDSTESMGLLGEIVSEIQNRNFDSIYSTSTLSRKQKEVKNKNKIKVTSPDSDYVNVSTIYKTPTESQYSNMNDAKSSCASSVSSDYIHPSAVNVPVKQVNEINKETPIMSTFKTDKPFTSTFTRSSGPLASTFKSGNPQETKSINENSNNNKTPPSPTNKKLKTSPSSVRSRKPSPTRPNVKNRSITNSPDLVMSCNAKPNVKPPDVLNGGSNKKPAIVNAKPNVNNLPKGPVKTGKITTTNTTNGGNGGVSTANVKNLQDKILPTSKTNKTSSASLTTTTPSLPKNNVQNSVTLLQQKFENKSKYSQKTKT